MDDPLDLAFARFHETDVEYSSGRTNGLSNHGPMAAEALFELGGGARLSAFTQRSLERLRPLPPPSPMAPRLGDPASARGWLEHYEPLLAAGDWRPPLRAALRLLLPGAVAGATHGWLRTAHAVRALSNRDAPVRRRELAFGLAAWAARYQTLPGHPGSRREPGLTALGALARVPLVPPGSRVTASLILDRLGGLADSPAFAATVDAVDLDAEPFEDAVSGLAAAAARLFLATPEARFVYLHAITSTTALRLVAPALDDAGRRAALGALFQAVAALHATHADPSTSEAALTSLEQSPGSARVETDAELAFRVRETALARDDDHDLKLAEAALREHRASGRRELLLAAATRLRL